MADDPGTAKTDALLDSGITVRAALLWVWGYAVVCSLVAVGISAAAVGATSSVLPATATKYATLSFVVIAAGLACEKVLGSIAEAARRR
jgi:hypothetical protein